MRFAVTCEGKVGLNLRHFILNGIGAGLTKALAVRRRTLISLFRDLSQEKFQGGANRSFRYTARPRKFGIVEPPWKVLSGERSERGTENELAVDGTT